jgi:hypothetical protein
MCGRKLNVNLAFHFTHVSSAVFTSVPCLRESNVVSDLCCQNRLAGHAENNGSTEVIFAHASEAHKPFNLLFPNLIREVENGGGCHRIQNFPHTIRQGRNYSTG